MNQGRDTFRSSLWGWLLGTAAGLGTVLLALVGIGVTAVGSGNWGLWPLVLTLAALAIFAVKWLAVLSSHYELTAERLILRRGLIMKSIDEIELYRIKDVRMDFSLLNQMAGIGDITITSSDETTRNKDLTMVNVPRAKERREMLRALVDAARKKRGVREMDMFTEPT